MNLAFVHRSRDKVRAALGGTLGVAVSPSSRRRKSMSQLRDGVPTPANPIAALPLRTGVLFPGATLTFAVGRARSVALVRSLYPGDVVLTLTQKDPRPADLDKTDVFPFGTFARVRSVTRKSDREYELSL